MNNYIVTNLGFVKSVTFNKETLKHVIEYTDKLRYAQPYKTKNANNAMKKHGISGFIYKPFEAEPVRNMYEVKLRTNWHILGTKNHSIKEWMVERAMMVNETDVAFLSNGKLNSSKLFSLEEAKLRALELNQAMLNELQEKVNGQKNEIEQIKNSTD
jgi:hypothetical protein